MKEKKISKFNLILYILIFIFLVLMFSGTFYLYYIKEIKSNDEPKIIYNNVNLLVNYSYKDTIDLKTLNPGFTESYDFSIENSSSDITANYKIMFEVITPLSNMIDENFVYTLESTSDKVDNTNKLVSKNETPVPISNKELGTAVITPQNKHSYKLTLQVKSNGQAYNYLNGKIFVARIKIMDAQ